MAGSEILHDELVGVYSVEVTGVKRTRAQAERLDNLIRSMRATKYSQFSAVTTSAAGGSNPDLFVAAIDQLEGRVVTKASDAMKQSMDFGKDLQAAALQAAVTPTGQKRKHGNGPGRDDTGAMIDELVSNVEVLRLSDSTRITGYHGWPENTSPEVPFQEKGTKGRGGLARYTARLVGQVYRAPNGAHRPKGATGHKGVPAANSLGTSIIPTREALRTLIGRLR